MYPRLTSELRIRNMRVRNRIMLAAMGTELCEPDGCCGQGKLLGTATPQLTALLAVFPHGLGRGSALLPAS